MPRPNPSIAFWQEPIHPRVSNIRSTNLAETTDVVVIGSGVTASGVTKSLLESPAFAGQRVTVLEARALNRSATGRNGGHLVSEAVLEYGDLEACLGREKACQAARFNLQCVERVREVVAGMDQEVKRL